MSHDLISHETLALIIFSLVICSKRTSRGSGTKMMEMIGPSRKALGVFTILLSFIQVTTSGRALLSGKKIKRNSIIFCLIRTYNDNICCMQARETQH